MLFVCTCVFCFVCYLGSITPALLGCLYSLVKCHFDFDFFNFLIYRFIIVKKNSCLKGTFLFSLGQKIKLFDCNVMLYVR